MAFAQATKPVKSELVSCVSCVCVLNPQEPVATQAAEAHRNLEARQTAGATVLLP